VAVDADIGVGRRRPVRQNDVEPVQGQIRQQVRDLAFVAQQTQVGLVDHRLHQAAHHQLGQAVRNADRQAHAGCADGVAHAGRQLLTQLKDLFGLAHRRRTSLGQDEAAAGRPEQRVAERAFELTHLRAHGLHRHVQPRRRWS
jgi:hypothetical protein